MGWAPSDTSSSPPINPHRLSITQFSSPPHRSSLPAGGCSGLVGAGGIRNVKLEILKVKS